MAVPASAYPPGPSVDVALRDGTGVHIRPVRGEDRDAIRAFLGSLSSDSIAFRFFGIPDLDWVVNWSIDVDYANRYALVATTGPEHAIVAHGAYLRSGMERAEVAFMVADALQGEGIATIMLAYLAAVAERHGIRVFTAEVLPDNHRMIEVFRESGFPVELRSRQGVTEVELPTSLTEETLEAFERREQTAAIAAVGNFLEPDAERELSVLRRGRSAGFPR